MGRPRVRYSEADRALEDWGEWQAKLRAFGHRYRTPEARVKDEAEGAGIQGTGGVRGHRALIPNFALRTPETVRAINSLVLELPAEMRLLAELTYVDRARPRELRARLDLSGRAISDMRQGLLSFVESRIGRRPQRQA